MLKIVTYPNDILREKMPEFDFDNPIADPALLEQQMLETMNANNGMGLSANQVNIRTRMFVMVDSSYATPGKAYFNPAVVETVDVLHELDEGCLSFPKLFVKVKRPKAIKATWQNSNGEHESGIFTGYECRCFLHELDHLEGIVYKDRVSHLRWDTAVRKLKKGTYR